MIRKKLLPYTVNVKPKGSELTKPKNKTKLIQFRQKTIPKNIFHQIKMKWKQMRIFYLALLLLLFLFYGCESSIVDDPSTVINYSVSERSHVKLTIENSYNTLIATLVDEEQFAGTYQASFEADNLAEGIYFYTLELNGIDGDFYSKVTKAMVLVK